MAEVKIGDRVRHVTARDYNVPAVVEDVVQMATISWMDRDGHMHRMGVRVDQLEVVQFEPVELALDRDGNLHPAAK